MRTFNEHDDMWLSMQKVFPHVMPFQTSSIYCFSVYLFVIDSLWISLITMKSLNHIS